MNHFAVIRIPHEAPARIHFDVAPQNYNEYNSFWDDAYTNITFTNPQEMQAYLENRLQNTGLTPEHTQLFHQSVRVAGLIREYLNENQSN